jgi:hypothetical protein
MAEFTKTLIVTQMVTNGYFATDSDWTKGANWTISGGSASRSTPSAQSSIQ